MWVEERMKFSNKLKKFLLENIIETLIAIGVVFVFVGVNMLNKPISFITLGMMMICVAFIAYKNQ